MEDGGLIGLIPTLDDSGLNRRRRNRKRVETDDHRNLQRTAFVVKHFNEYESSGFFMTETNLVITSSTCGLPCPLTLHESLVQAPVRYIDGFTPEQGSFGWLRSGQENIRRKQKGCRSKPTRIHCPAGALTARCRTCLSSEKRSTANQARRWFAKIAV